MASRTPEQVKAQKKYAEKLQDIKVCVPKQYFEVIQYYADKKEQV